MLSNQDAMQLVERDQPGARAVACAPYRNILLVRVVHADPLEANFDPFFSVNPTTGEVKDYSVMHDGNIAEIAKLFPRVPPRN